MLSSRQERPPQQGGKCLMPHFLSLSFLPITRMTIQHVSRRFCPLRQQSARQCENKNLAKNRRKVTSRRSIQSGPVLLLVNQESLQCSWLQESTIHAKAAPLKLCSPPCIMLKGVCSPSPILAYSLPLTVHVPPLPSFLPGVYHCRIDIEKEMSDGATSEID